MRAAMTVTSARTSSTPTCSPRITAARTPPAAARAASPSSERGKEGRRTTANQTPDRRSWGSLPNHHRSPGQRIDAQRSPGRQTQPAAAIKGARRAGTASPTVPARPSPTSGLDDDRSDAPGHRACTINSRRASSCPSASSAGHSRSAHRRPCPGKTARRAV
jgi:hypothetical protein